MIFATRTFFCGRDLTIISYFLDHEDHEEQNDKVVHQGGSPMTGQLSGLFIYPVKSLGGIAVPAAGIEARGLAGDRRWMVVSADGRFQSQRQEPRLALVSVAAAPAGWTLTAPGQAPLHLNAAETGPRRAVQVWQSQLPAAAAPAEVDRWLSDFLATPCHLVHLPEDVVRPVTSAAGHPGDEVSFADGFPYLLTSTASLEDLNGRLQTPVGMERFRPNLVVSGPPPFREDRWQSIQIGAITFRMAKTCPRCQVINVDPRTGRRGSEPLATLARYRRRDDGVMFGINLVAENSGQLALGDPLRVLA